MLWLDVLVVCDMGVFPHDALPNLRYNSQSNRSFDPAFIGSASQHASERSLYPGGSPSFHSRVVPQESMRSLLTQQDSLRSMLPQQESTRSLFVHHTSERSLVSG